MQLSMARLSIMPAALAACFFSLAIAQSPSLAQVRLAQADRRTLVDIQSQLSDLSQFPLFLSSDPSILVAASDRLSPSMQSQPSLSWIEDQIGMRYGSDRLIEQWQAYRISGGLSYVDIIVNESIWGLLNYFERYAFISQFATAAKSYDYNVRVFHTGDVANQQDARRSARRFRNNTRVQSAVLRGANFCNFKENAIALPTLTETALSEESPFAQTAAGPSEQLRCNIILEVLSNRPIRKPLEFEDGLTLP